LEQLQFARQVMRSEGEAILVLADQLNEAFCQAVELIHRCQGNVIVTGMGKAGLIGQKVAATLASTGTCSHFLHPGEAVHGDLGRIHHLDVVLAFSFSGETGEVTRLLGSLAARDIPVIAITRSVGSTLARAAQATLQLGPLREACSLGLAPSTSTTAMLALGDALALVVSRRKGFQVSDFARFHPSGSLGRQLTRVEEAMRRLGDCRVAQQTCTVREVLVQVSRPGRRTGAVMLVDGQGQLSGLFTDSDLARMLEHNQEGLLDEAIERVMTRQPTTIAPRAFLKEAVELMAEKKISELPVVDRRCRPVGLIDITDLLADTAGTLPAAASRGSGTLSGQEPWRATTIRFPQT
jgi:arabinose-5-phosphate isomerase